MLSGDQRLHLDEEDTFNDLHRPPRDSQHHRHCNPPKTKTTAAPQTSQFQVSCAPLQATYENCSRSEDIDQTCLYPSYFSYFAVLILIAASLPPSLSYLYKSLLMVLLTSAHCLINMVVLESALDCEESRNQWSKYGAGDDAKTERYQAVVLPGRGSSNLNVPKCNCECENRLLLQLIRIRHRRKHK